MNEENKNINLPEETSYTPTDSKKTNSLEGVTAPVLDDIDYYTPTPKKDGPKGVEAPVLDDMDAFVPNSSKRTALRESQPRFSMMTTTFSILTKQLRNSLLKLWLRQTILTAPTTFLSL